MLAMTKKNKSLFDGIFGDFDDIFGSRAPWVTVTQTLATDSQGTWTKTDEGFDLTMDVPGCKSEHVTVQANQGVLEIIAQRPDRTGGRLTSKYQIGESYDINRTEASVSDGVLTVRLKRLADEPDTKVVKIAVK